MVTAHRTTPKNQRQVDETSDSNSFMGESIGQTPRFTEISRASMMSDDFDIKEESSGVEADAAPPEQSKNVMILRLIMYITFVLSVVGITAGAISLRENGKHQALEEEVENLADDAIMNLGSFIHAISTQLAEVSAALTAQYISSNPQTAQRSAESQGFSDITLPFFDQRVQVQQDADVIFYTPIISGDVTSKQKWQDYASQHQGWIDQDLQQRGWTPINTEIPNSIHQFSGYSSDQELNSFQQMSAPIWQFSPPPKDRSIINLDALTYPFTKWTIQETLANMGSKEPRLSQSFDAEFLLQYAETSDPTTGPRTLVSVPVYKSFDGNATPEVLGQVFALMSWEKALAAAFDGVNMDLQVDVKESCGFGFSFVFQAGKMFHLPSDSDTSSKLPLSDLEVHQTLDHLESCQYTMLVHPIEGTEIVAVPPNSLWVPLFAGLILLFLLALFHLHNRLSKVREAKILAAAQSSAAMVSSFFPSTVQSRLMAEVEAKKRNNRRVMLEESGSVDFSTAKEIVSSKPIADFFPEATIMFADIVGFTAWSSMREPSQVFTLLEALYHSFDGIARRRSVFKVETIGDCYVAVVGLPEPCKDHAVVMSRFATDCVGKMTKVVRALEVSLGPDTADLALRVGLHSGPVTAGVLRGDKARFQLFGDTMNTCSRIETTGKPNRIHISQETANLLRDAGKEKWITQREDKVTAKGKGQLTTFWLNVTKSKADGSAGVAMSASLHSVLSTSFSSGFGDEISEKHNRLVDWITNELGVLLRVVEMNRMMSPSSVSKPSELSVASLERASLDSTMKSTPITEIKEVIYMPPFDHSVRDLPDSEQVDSFELSDDVLRELRDFVSNIALMYRDNPFHNFEHASHVTMSVVKLLTRIVAPHQDSHGQEVAEELHRQTYGIASDPLTQFTMVLSALVHDVDHPGVSNAQLIKEKTSLARLYGNKSVAEQNSIDKTWILLMEGGYQKLRSAIYKTEDEFIRFRSILVNTVMATDIMDKGLSEARRDRWNKAFDGELNEDPVTASNRKATIVLEHLIQASDVAHTMQHWHIYRRWNEQLYNEIYMAHNNGRAQFDPTDGWYRGEIGFYDFYIIPLAKKLKDCGVFGVSSDEYLNYAQQNRREWELNGKEVVASMKEKAEAAAAAAAATAQALTRTSSQKSLIGPQTSKVGSTSSLGESKSNSERECAELPVKFSILIVDDDRISRKMLSNALKKVAPDWSIDHVESGEDALHTVSSDNYDLIFVDEYMGNNQGELLGSNTVRKLREQGFGSLICGMSASDAHATFKDAGADAFVFKPLPFRPATLTQELGRIISKSNTG